MAIGNRERRRAAARGGIRRAGSTRKAEASNRRKAGDNLRTPDRQPASECEQVVSEGETTTADGNRRQKNGREEKAVRPVSRAAKRRKPHQSAVKALSTYG